MSKIHEELSVASMVKQRYMAVAKGVATRTFFYGFIGALIYVAIFVLDLVSYSLKNMQGTTLDILRTSLQILTIFFWSKALGPFIVRYRDLSRRVGKPEASIIPVRVIRWFAIIVAVGELFSFLPNLFNLKLTTDYVPQVPNTVITVDIMGIVWLTGFAAIIVGFSKFLFLWQKTKEIRRKFYIWFVPIGLYALINYLRHIKALPDDTSVEITTYGLYFLVIFSTLFLWFKIEWIPHVSRKEKNKVLVFSALASVLSILIVISYSSGLTGGLLTHYAVILQSVIQVSMLGISVYFGLIFFHALFSLSSTELVERRAAEVQSLAKLTRFSSDVLTSELLLDIQRLADQITALAKEATKSDCAWLEMNFRPAFGAASGESRLYRSYNDISQETADLLLKTPHPHLRSAGGLRSLSEELSATTKPVLITAGDLMIEAPNVYDGTITEVESLIAVPLLHREELRGAIYVAKEQEYGYDDEDVTVLTAFSDIASLALDTARLLADSIEKQKFDGELRAARSMQQSLLPNKVPEVAGYEIAAISIPAYEVGGDYYDFTTLSDNSPIVVIGDVSGKGISASIFMAEIKGIVQALGPKMDDLRQLFIGTNDALMRNIAEQGFRRAFVTLAAIGIKDGLLTYSRAGHTPLLIFSANSDYQYLQPKGMGLGFVGKQIFDGVLEQKTIALDPGETLILFSDGITEVRGADGEELGYARFAEIVRAARFEDTIQKMTDKVLRDVLLYSGDASFSDDATFVIIRKL
jgi:sigma-B regulation protein RsbU (phosphoserine phosphatase)